uniref:Phospholipase B-like n=2 Tax=Gouania willdenowi TaxID=441366 RepID=A0A8C5GIB8_GOUWI
MIISCFFIVKTVALPGSPLIGQTLQSPPLLCERAPTQAEKTWLKLACCDQDSSEMISVFYTTCQWSYSIGYSLMNPFNLLCVMQTFGWKPDLLCCFLISWSFLEVTSSSLYNESFQAYAAGAVEAAVTSQLIYKHWMNTLMGYCGPFTSDIGYCERLKAFIGTNMQWVQKQIQKNPSSPYWYQVHLALLQLKGMEDSYNAELSFPTGQFSINPMGFLLFQLGGDLEDLESALNKSSQTRALGSGSCSALIKLLPNNKELLVSHDTWNTYQSMLRIMKKYTFAFKASPSEHNLLPGRTQAFSSYPGSIFSGDDFYILSSGLVTMETTIGNNNPALWKFVQPTGTVMEWLRNIVANRLASTGREWAEIFSKYNSGTYNNQWMIVDYNHFTPGKSNIKEGLFVVLEQIPGLVMFDDKTQELMKKGYWASYNIPYFVDIFNASGCNELVEKFGPWFSLDKNPRAQIFRRNQTDVTDVDSMLRLMRYNNYLEDPLSKCDGCNPAANGENAISARSDLNPANGTYPFGALKQRPHGGTDMKMTSYEMYRAYGMVAVSGPTFDQVPPFQWSSSPFKDLMHMGHPDIWNFKPINVTWTN